MDDLNRQQGNASSGFPTRDTPPTPEFPAASPVGHSPDPATSEPSSSPAEPVAPVGTVGSMEALYRAQQQAAESQGVSGDSHIPSSVEPRQETPKKKPSLIPVILVAGVFCCALCFVVGTLLGRGTYGSGTMGTLPSSDASSASGVVSGSSSSGSALDDGYVFETQSSGEAYTIRSVASMTMDSVVEITTETVTTGSFLGQYVATGAGSGVIVREDGLIVTNNHVIDGASAITVRLRSGEEYEATLLGTDAETDIALLRIDAKGLSAAVMGDSSGLLVGDEVVAIGNPLGSLGGTVTNGIVSALERQITIDGQTMTLLQTNAAINPGNSGGGLFNLSGELIGVVNAKSSGEDIEGLGFAIPINTAKPVIEDLLNYGYVRGKVKLGVSLLDIYSDSYVRYYGVPVQGTYVSEVTDNSDGAKAGLQSGDRILTVNGTAVKASTDVSDVVKGSSVGDRILLEIERYTYRGNGMWNSAYDTEKLTIEVILTEYTSGNPLIGS